MIRILKESETRREAIFARTDPVESVEAPVRAIIEDVRARGDEALLLANRQAYILIGSLSQIFKSSQGITAWAAGTVLVDRDDKRSRAASKEKLIRVEAIEQITPVE